MRGMLKEWLLRLVLLAGSLVFALLVAEVLLRVVAPINDGRANVALDGRPITGWFEPGSVYRQVSNEYDVLTTITDKGHRVPGASGNPDVVFLGDSFTYGWGLSDTESFASIYCATVVRECANLGAPGTGTLRQVRRLRHFLTAWHWRPREVKLFFFGMSSSFSAGNDFVDNYTYGRWMNGERAGEVLANTAGQEPTLSLAARVIGWQSRLLEHSNLVRFAKFHWGPLLRSLLLADPGQERMAEALMYTEEGFAELDELSRDIGFEYSVYLIVPVQDIIRGTHGQTLATLNRVSRTPAVSTATLFVAAPQQFYYAYDGHLNAKGSRRIAELLVSLDGNRFAGR
jgi:hypothetical protein